MRGPRQARSREPVAVSGSLPRIGMAGWWRALARAARRYPWPTNVLLYAALFSSGDALQQRLRGGPADWRQTRQVGTVVVAFHANFNYVWQRLLERALPGRTPRAVLAKVLCDQVVAAPIAVSAFYTGEGTGDRSLGGMEGGRSGVHGQGGGWRCKGREVWGPEVKGAEGEKLRSSGWRGQVLGGSGM